MMDVRFLQWRRQDDAMVIFELVQQALLPFKCHHITAEIVEDLMGRSLKITVDILPRHQLMVSLDDRLIATFPETYAEEVGIRVADYYRNLHVPVDDHIHLGEN